MKLDTIHIGPHNLSQTIVGRGSWDQWSQCQPRYVFVHELRHERDMEEELHQNWSQLRICWQSPKCPWLTSSFSPKNGDQFFSISNWSSLIKSREPGAHISQPCSRPRTKVYQTSPVCSPNTMGGSTPARFRTADKSGMTTRASIM